MLAVVPLWITVRTDRADANALAALIERERRLHLALEQARDRVARAARVRRDWEAGRTAPVSGAAPDSRQPLWPEEDRALQENASLQALYLRQTNAHLHWHYLPLYRALGLSAEAIAKIDAAGMREAERTLDFRLAAQAQGLTPDDPAVQADRKQADQEFQAELLGILGPEGARQYQQFVQTDRARSLVSRLAGTLATSDEPITAEQAGSLVQAFAQSTATYQGGGAADLNAMNWNDAFVNARQVLTPAQIALLQATQAYLEQSGALARLTQLAAQTDFSR